MQKLLSWLMHEKGLIRVAGSEHFKLQENNTIASTNPDKYRIKDLMVLFNLYLRDTLYVL